MSYIKSFNLFFLIAFAWVPIRFLMNPVHKLGGTVEGGSGVSGATPYFYYVFAAGILLILGAILNSREKIVNYMNWCLWLAFIIGVGFLHCAFIPATAPFSIHGEYLRPGTSETVFCELCSCLHMAF